MPAFLWQRIRYECLDLWASVADLLFPRVCVVCENSLVRGEKYLCTSCLADFPFTDTTYDAGENLLEHFDEAYRPEELYTLFYYNKYDIYKKLIYNIKYQSYKHLAFYLGQMLGERIPETSAADIIIPIPLHPRRLRERGYNQAFEIARGISEVLHIDILDDVVVRIKNNVSQTGKNASERLKNVEHIFQLINPQKIIGKRILLVDDVITTGATIGSCMQVLSQAGDVHFCLGCLARTL